MEIVKDKPANKTCNSCGKEKSYSEYYKYKTNRDGYMAICKECHLQNGKDQHLMRQFGITRADYDAMYVAQNGSCACCGKHQVELNVTLAVDHCHNTGQVRGLLCGSCNRGIGLLGDNLEGVHNALKYLEDTE